ncbi:N-acetylmuramoyl-L-alanine amidase [Mangrovibacillus cuniculi]|uniref:SH3 domain-containing protein n=1 Tax=Mangrovibacillus cuniculi TaxID=2593652 RepID=A0A7S8CCQ5_9BACI|nr:N-acetylmuramoyl-L-alanine amidase [Mangrovibacillus cuniculi]QPC47566.1 SH3 domain-containing protein [Mangrovibacillus cuniculi]
MKKMSRTLVAGLALTLTLASYNGNLVEVHANDNTVTEVANAPLLTDIPTRSKKEIDYLLTRSIITGYPDNTFRPSQYVTRGEAATLIGNSLGYSSDKRKTTFPDVPVSYFASGYIAQAAEAKVIGGYNDGTYRPYKQITRGEMAALLTRAYPSLSRSISVMFKDVPKGSMWESSVAKLLGNGITVGYPDLTFRPDNYVTREEFALFVARALNDSFRVAVPEIASETRTVTADVLNVRSGPSTSYDIVGKLLMGTSVQVLKVEGSWAYISLGTLTGYVSTSYLAPVSQPSNPEISRYIALDAGHGGTDPGAVGNNLHESEIVLDVTKKVQAILEKKGIKVYLTRPDNTFVSLDDRVKKAVNAKVDTFVSIHANSFTNSSANGTETYYSAAALSQRAEDSKQLATFIQTRLVKALKTNDRGVKDANFRVISTIPVPAALVELAFISNVNDAQKLASQAYRNAAAEAIAGGIEDYYNWKLK